MSDVAVLTVAAARGSVKSRMAQANVQTLERPDTAIVRRTSKELYSGRANRVVVKHHLGRLVAVIEVLSPGNKHSRVAVREFVEKAVAFLHEGIHLLVIDLFPPTARDPFGIHKLIWDEFQEEDFVFPPGNDRILASYEAGLEWVAYVEPVAIGDRLRDMPLFLADGVHVYVPLESTYAAAWDASPSELRAAVETGVLPPREETA
jgi:hypothetical protein